MCHFSISIGQGAGIELTLDDMYFKRVLVRLV